MTDRVDSLQLFFFQNKKAELKVRIKLLFFKEKLINNMANKKYSKKGK